MAATSSAVADSPSSSDFISVARMMAMVTSRRPIIAVPAASQRPLPVARVRTTPASAKTRPSRAPKSSSSTIGSSGALAVRTKPTQDRAPLCGRDSWIAVRKEKLSRPIDATSTTIGTHCHESIPCGSWNLCQAS